MLNLFNKKNNLNNNLFNLITGNDDKKFKSPKKKFYICFLCGEKTGSFNIFFNKLNQDFVVLIIS